MKKDYLAFNRFILTQENLTLEEGYMMNVLFQCHNETLGYAYPSYKALMKYCKTNRQAKVSKIIKSLADKGYITIQNHKNNRYFIVGINEFIQGSNNENNDNSNTDSNNNDDNNTNSKDNSTSNNNNTNSEFDGLTVSQERTLMKLAKTKERLKEIIEYSRSKAKNLFAYCYRLLKDNIQVNTSYSYSNSNNYSYASNNYGNQNNNISTPRYNGFNNFKAREYDYEDLEWRLLGWK